MTTFILAASFRSEHARNFSSWNSSVIEGVADEANQGNRNCRRVPEFRATEICSESSWIWSGQRAL